MHLLDLIAKRWHLRRLFGQCLVNLLRNCHFFVWTHREDQPIKSFLSTVAEVVVLYNYQVVLFAVPHSGWPLTAERFFVDMISGVRVTEILILTVNELLQVEVSRGKVLNNGRFTPGNVYLLIVDIENALLCILRLIRKLQRVTYFFLLRLVLELLRKRFLGAFVCLILLDSHLGLEIWLLGLETIIVNLAPNLVLLGGGGTGYPGFLLKQNALASGILHDGGPWRSVSLHLLLACVLVLSQALRREL